MRKLNQVFFSKEGEKGLNETSAAHLCALASQVKEHNEKVLANVNFVSSSVSVVGQDGDNTTESGLTEAQLPSLLAAVEQVAKMNAFISWFAEARKELEAYKSERLKYDVYEWAEELGIEMPESPKARYGDVKMSTLEDVINEMNIKDREIYLALEAKAAVYGKFIHPRQPMETARARMHRIISAPYETQGSGRDTLIFHRMPSVEPEKVDELFNYLQSEYRSIEQSLNHMKSDLRRKLEAKNLAENNEKQTLIQEYKNANKEYADKMSEITAKYNQWLTEEQGRISKLKFAIPEDLKVTVDYLNSLGKK